MKLVPFEIVLLVKKLNNKKNISNTFSWQKYLKNKVLLQTLGNISSFVYKRLNWSVKALGLCKPDRANMITSRHNKHKLLPSIEKAQKMLNAFK